VTDVKRSALADALRERYLLERELGAGGMATVYLAQDVRHHRRVALKVLKPELAAVIGAERFLLGRRGMANTYRVPNLEQDLDFVGTNRLVQLAGVISLLSVAFSCAPASSRSTSAPRPIAVGACQALQPTSVGGPAAPPATIVLRWLGTANYEVTYKGKVVLLDAFIDRGPRNRPIGVAVKDMQRVDVILVGHGHWDHVADAATIARQSRAVVVGAASAIDVVRAAGLPLEQTRVVEGTGGELLQFEGFTVEPVLAHHSILLPDVLTKFREALTSVDSGPSQDEASAEAVIEARGSSDPTLGDRGTLAYLLTFDTGFRLIWLDSAGPITEAERSLMQRISRTDVAIVAYQGQYVADRQVAATFPLVKLFNPAVYLPAHHDKLAGLFLDIGLEPLFMAMRHDLPETQAMAPLYLSPVCLSAKPDQR
jgi:L-ascorbate metabolism protein UlaG (beta-lactamase superfamily)